MKKSMAKLTYFLLPFLGWGYAFFKKADLIVIFKRPFSENSFIISQVDLWKIVMVFFVFQLGNYILAKLFSNKIFVKINYLFILFHLLVVIYLLKLNFF